MRLPMPVSGRGMKHSASALEQSRRKVGYRFHPTDEELISWYLKPKTLGENNRDDEVIGEIDVCKFEPWDLPRLSKSKSDDQVWYFLCPRDLYMNSRRSKRRTEAGFWKPTGKKLTIKAWRTKREIGSKKTLVFYRKASPKALRTRWIIHEYEYIPEPNLTIQKEFVLIKLKNKDTEKRDEGDRGHSMVSNGENQATFDVQEQATPAVHYHSKSNVKDQTSVVQNQTSSDTTQNQAAEDFRNEGNQDVSHSFFSDPLNQLLDEIIPDSDSPMARDSSNQNPSEFRDGLIPSMETPPASNCLMAKVSPYESLQYKDYPNGPMAQDKEADMSASREGEWVMPLTLSLDIVIENHPHTKSDMPILEQGNWHFGKPNPHTNYNAPILEPSNQYGSLAYSTENDVPQKDVAMSSELSPELWEKFIRDNKDLLISSLENETPSDNNGVSCPRDSDVLYQSPYGNGVSSNQHGSLAFFPESDEPQKEAAMSPELSPQVRGEFTGDDMDISYFDQTPSDNNEVSCPRDSDDVYQSPYGNGVSSSLNATGIKNRNEDKIADVSASHESEKNPLVAAPLDSEPQNTCMSDLLAPGGNCYSPLMASLSEHVEQGGIVLTEEQSQQLEWEAFLDLQNRLNSNVVLQSTSTEEVPSDNGTNASGCT